MLMEHLTLWRSIPPRSRLEASSPPLEALSFSQSTKVRLRQRSAEKWEKAVDASVRSIGNRIRFPDDFTLSLH